MKKTIFFDCFGVIVSEIAIKWFDKYYDDKAIARRLKDEIFVPGDSGLISEDEAYSLMAKGVNITKEEVREFWYNDITLNNELIKFIEELGKEYDIYLLSNAISSYVRNLLKKNNLERLFKKIYISSEIKHIKPNKDYFEYVLNDLNLEAKDCVMIDDNPNNIKTAVSLGLNGIVFKNNDQFKKDILDIIN